VDYDLEDPHQDVRGFRVDELMQDFDEAKYFVQDQNRKLSFQESRATSSSPTAPATTTTRPSGVRHARVQAAPDIIAQDKQASASSRNASADGTCARPAAS